MTKSEPIRPSTSSGLRILYMEDDPALARLVQMRLEQAGYIVDLACDGEEGLSMYAAGSYDVVAVDQNMPIHDGLEVIRIMASQGPLPPTIMVTGTGSEQIAVEAMKLGAQDYIVKDMDGGYFDLLPSVIEQVLQQQRLAEEKRRAEKALLRLEMAVEQSIDGIAVADMDGNIQFVNPAWAQMHGYSATEELLGRHLSIFHTEEQLQEDVIPFNERVMEFGAHQGEVGHARKDGTTFPTWMTVTLVKDERGNPTGLVGAARDITERKRAEEHLQRYTAELEQANEEIKRFAYTISHDLRAPLVNLKGFAAELRSALEVIGSAMDTALSHPDENQQQVVTTALHEDAPEALGFIDSSVARIDRFINAFLKLSRLSCRELNLEPIDMEALVQATLKTLAHQIKERQVQVTVGSLPEVVADRTSMEQITGNLLTNAVLYLDPDRPGEIEISGERSDDETVFHVRDNGRGVAEEDMDKVFAPFRRAGRQDMPGEGMGLPYVQALVRRHGGRIWCESELGVGTTFTFTLSNHLMETSF